MRLRLRLILTLFACPFWAGTFAIGEDVSPDLPAIKTVAEIRALSGPASHTARSLALGGIVTFVDAARNVLVLQDATGAVLLRPDPPGIVARPGQRVLLKASDCAPSVFDCPSYPYHPAGEDIRPTFEAPDNEGNFRLTRMRAWLCPPVTGNYTFWISSDDSSDLWLSTGPDPTQARRIAYVPAGGWASRHEWSRFPTQRSETVSLRAGQFYYIEALQEQQLQEDHLAVAWEGPDMKQAIIDGKYLIPWTATTGHFSASDAVDAGHGILREYWTNYSVGSVTNLTRGITPEGGLIVRGMTISVQEDGVWPAPLHILPGQNLRLEDVYQWVEGEGAVSFLSSEAGAVTVELTDGENHASLSVAHWQGELPALGPNVTAKFKGVCEGGYDLNGNLIAGFISANSEKDLVFSKPSDTASQPTPPTPVAVPKAPVMGGYYLMRGVVTFNDRVLDKDCLFAQDTLAGIFISQEERHLEPTLQVGDSVGIGGHLLPGKHSPGILPLGVTILGRQNMPQPVVLSQDSPTDSYRDGQWTEMEGVVAAVNANGTIVIMGKQTPFLAWIGRLDPAEAEKLVNSTVRLRGVMSLDLFDSPILLVSSRSFVEVIEPAPILPTAPLPISSLKKIDSTTGWAHQAKVAGIVTYRDDHSFFLQDSTGGVRVHALHAPPAEVGGTVEVVGFSRTERGVVQLLEGTWNPVANGTPITPASVSPENPDSAANGSLVKAEARLLSQETRGTNHVMELQSGQHVFEAVLNASLGKLPEFDTGSVLEVTGIGVLEPVPVQGPKAQALGQLLLRTPLDVELLQNPPWWTWKRAAVFIGALLSVLLVSLLRIQYLSHRFTRQQAARLVFAREMLQSQEGERRRIAASLHDSLGQGLLVIRNQAHRAMQAAGEDSILQVRLKEISTTTLQALEEVREIIHNLRPYQLDRLGLSQAILATTRKVSESSPVMFASLVDDIDGVFDAESEIHIYRIVQEAINNVVKHSGATEATVVIKKGARNLSISVRDNGGGLMPTGTPSGAGFGLSGMQERTKIMGGTLKIESLPGQGVNLQVELPLPPITNALKN